MSDLDEFFARCDDVLQDWHGGTDAMVCEPSKGEVDLPRGDSYYDQRTYWRPERVESAGEQIVADMWTQFLAEQIEHYARRWIIGNGQEPVQPRGILSALDAPATVRFEFEPPEVPTIETEPESPRDRALRLRRERNTGPVRDVRLDRGMR